jgi:hypothetical protein
VFDRIPLRSHTHTRERQANRYTVAVDTQDEKVLPFDPAGCISTVPIQLHRVGDENHGADKMWIDIDRLVVYTGETGGGGPE